MLNSEMMVNKRERVYGSCTGTGKPECRYRMSSREHNCMKWDG